MFTKLQRKMMSSILATLMVLSVLFTAIAPANQVFAASENPVSVSLRVEGPQGLIKEGIGEGSTALEALVAQTDITPIVSSSPYGAYVTAINGIQAATYGGYDGWNYAIKRQGQWIIPDVGIDQYALESNDQVIVYYGDLSTQLIQSISSSSSSIKANESFSISVTKTTYDWANTGYIISPANGVKVTVGSAVSVTDTSGVAVFANGVTAGNYTLAVTDYRENAAPGIVRATQSLTIDPSPTSGTTHDISAAIEAASTYIKSRVGGVNSDWSAIGLARTGHKLPETYLQNLENSVKNSQANFNPATDLERTILGITVASGDPTSVASYNLIEKLYNNSTLTIQGVNSPIFALIALDAKNFTVPQDALWTRQLIIDDIISKQKPDGGFALFGDTSDPDLTAMALTALAPYHSNQAVIHADTIPKIVSWLTLNQQANGGYLSYGVDSSESVSQAIIALASNGIDPTSTAYTKNGVNLVDKLFQFRLADGSFSHTLELASNGIATEQALQALAAYKMFLEGHGERLYDFTNPLPGLEQVAASQVKIRIEGPESRIAEGTALATTPLQALKSLASAKGIDIVEEAYGVTINGIRSDSGFWDYAIHRNDGWITSTDAGMGLLVLKPDDDIVFYFSNYATMPIDSITIEPQTGNTLVENINFSVLVHKTEMDYSNFQLHPVVGDGVQVAIYNAAGNVVSSQTTDADGKAQFTHVPAGSYTVDVSGYVADVGPTIVHTTVPFQIQAAPQQTPIGSIIVSVEKFTLGQGYYREPQPVPFYNGDNGASILTRVLGAGNYRNSGSVQDYFYLSKVKDPTSSVQVPPYILDQIGAPLGSKAEAQWLGEFDYTSMSGWMYAVNNEFPNVGMSQYTPQNGDVMRVQFSVHGYGGDLGGEWGYIQTANKDALTAKIAEINSDPSKQTLLLETGVKSAYDHAYIVLSDMESTQASVNSSLADLTNSLAPDTEKPVISVTGLANNQEVSVPNLSFSVEVTDNKPGVLSPEVKQNGTTISKVNGVYALVLIPGVNTITVTATDLSGNTTTKTLIVTYKESLAVTAKNQLNKNLAYLVRTVTNPVFGTLNGEWTVLSLARANYEVSTGYYQTYYNNVVTKVNELMTANNGLLDKIKGTEHSRVILGLSSIGKDPKHVGSYDLTSALADYNYVITQGINGPIFALLAFDARNSEIPVAAVGKEQVTRDKLIGYMLTKEVKKGTVDAGGWGFGTTSADVDLTSMALQALAPYYQTQPDVKSAGDRAVAWLSKKQDSEGGFGSSSESISQVITALSALGIDPSVDERFIKNGKSALDALLSFAVADGGFKHTKTGSVNGMATEQGTYALVAFDRFLNGKNRLYDMTDIIVEDVEKPVVTVTGLSDNLEVSQAALSFNVAVTDNSPSNISKVVKLNGTVVSEVNGNYSIVLIPGSNTITVSATDSSGNITERTFTISYKQELGEVTLSVIGDTEKGTIVPAKKVVLYAGDTVFSVLQRELGDNVNYGEIGSSIHVIGIDGLSEFDRGPNSGWMFTVNGVFPSTDAGNYLLQKNDQVTWRYTLDLGNDLETSFAKEQLTKNLAYIRSTVAQPTFGTNGGEWSVLSLARANYSVPEGYYQGYYNNVVNSVKELMATNQGVLDKNKGSEHSRAILGLTSIGRDPRSVGGYNLFSALADYDYVIKQGLNGPIFALLALDTRNYDIPTVISGKKQVTRDKLIDYILSTESHKETIDAGGWSLLGTGNADVDITAMALQALAPYYESRSDVKSAGDRAVAWLAKTQNNDGGFGSTSESSAQVVTALSTLGINSSTDARFIKNGKSALYALLSFAAANGGFQHVKSGSGSGVNDMATDQGTYALVAYDRFVNGSKRLYDMTDVTEVTPTPGENELPLPGGNQPQIVIPPDNKDYIIPVTAADANKEIKIDIPSDSNAKIQVNLPVNSNLPRIEAVKGNVSMVIPMGAQITSGDSSALELITSNDPTSTSLREKVNTIITSGKKIDSVNQAITLGGSQRIEFDQFITLTLKDMKGKDAAYIQDGSIAAIKKYASDAEGLASGENEYAYDNGNDLIVKTKHFTEFIAFTLSVIQTPGGGTNPLPTSHVTLSVDKLTINKGYVVTETSVELKSGDSAWSVLKRELDRLGITYETEWSDEFGSVYVESIAGDGEFDHGTGSGWMYNVNGCYPGYGSDKYTLTNGESVQWRYTTDLGEDIGAIPCAPKPPGPIINPNDKQLIIDIPTDIKEDYRVSITNEMKDKELITINIPDAKSKVILNLTDVKDNIPMITAVKGNITVSIDKGTVLKSGDSNVELITGIDLNDAKLKTLVKSSLASGNASLTHAFAMGNANQSVIFDKPLTLVIKGVKDQQAGFIEGNAFTPIEIYATEAEGIEATKDKEKITYAFVKDNDLIIKTNHFTSFVTYTTSEETAVVFDINKLYSDVKSISSWAVDAIREATEKALVEGSNGQFSPQAKVTRAEFTKMLVGVLGLDVKAVKVINFKDVAQDDWFYTYVNAAYKAGLITGTSADQFSPNEKLTREQMAVIMVNALKLPTAGNALVIDDLEQMSVWAKASVQSVMAQGLISGWDNRFHPIDEVTREMATVVAMRAYHSINDPK
jgi:prenyltransferase beta subunit